ncbi:MAG: hypothetical protein NTX29_07055 [Actinobacteria bacterium]|nr:hypothetical protein [Actinomycetota bacterium]
MSASTGVPAADLESVALAALTTRIDDFGDGGFFMLAARLTSHLAVEDARRVFDAMGELFEDLAPSREASDGPFEAVPTATGDVDVTLAGLLWATLGDAAIATRWKAANAVLLLAQLGCDAELAALSEFASGHLSVVPYVDSRFDFYEQHARMWLFLALDRASSEPNASVLAMFVPTLRAAVLDDHAVNQVLAQRALRRLSAHQLPDVTADDPILDVRTAPLAAEFERRGKDLRPPLSPIDGDGLTDERFFFDFGHYWCDHLADAFAASVTDIVNRTKRTIESIDGFSHFSLGEDPRRDAGAYANGSTYTNHSAWPVQDDLDFYLAVHGMLKVGGGLARIHDALIHPGDEDDEYQVWLHRFLPAREDGRWVADARDPAPELRFPALTSDDEKTWRWSLTKRDFSERMGTDSEWIGIYEFSDVSGDWASEDVRIDSALVQPELAPAPPWLYTHAHADGIDCRDDRGSAVSFPLPRPATRVIEEFGLSSDSDQRLWLHGGSPAFRCSAWSNMDEDRERARGSHGQRIEVHRSFLSSLLDHWNRTLVIRVSIGRDMNGPYRSYHREEDEDEFRRIESSHKIYLIDSRDQWLEL